MEKKFASQADVEEKQASFDKLSDNAYAYTTEGDPNTGVVIGDDAVMVIDAQATPVMAQDVIRHIRQVTDKPIKYVVLTHYHAVRVLGASGYKAEHIIASRDTHDLIVERGEADMKSEIERFPRLFRAVESVPGLTWPTIVFEKRLTLMLGKLQVEIMQLGRGHTKGDTVVWLPQEKILFSGDLVEFDATPYTGDAYLTDWPATLDAVAALGPQKLVPGRGAALQTPAQVKAGLDGTRTFVTAMYESVKRGAGAGRDLRSVYKETYDALKAQVRPLGDLRSLFTVRREPRVRRSDRPSASAHLDRTARQGNVGVAGGITAPCTCRRFIRTSLHASLRSNGVARTQVVIVGAGPVGLGMRDRSRAAWHRLHHHRRQQHRQRRFARDLLGEANTRDFRSSGLWRCRVQSRCQLESRQGFFSRQARVSVRPVARARP